MIGYLQYWLMKAVAMGLTALLIPRLRLSSIVGPFLMVAALALVNATIWDAELFGLLPSSLSMQIVVLFTVNGFLFWLLVKLLPGIEVDGFLPALVAPIVFTVASMLVTEVSKRVDWPAVINSSLATIDELKTYLRSEPDHSQTSGIPSLLVSWKLAPAATPMVAPGMQRLSLA